MDIADRAADQRQPRMQHVDSTMKNNRNKSHVKMVLGMLVFGSFVVVMASMLVFQLLGTGLVVQFIVLVLNSVAFCALGAVAFTPPSACRGEPTSSLRTDSPSGVNRNGRETVSRRLRSASSTTSPLHWMGETVEGSMSWLRGDSRPTRNSPCDRGGVSGTPSAEDNDGEDGAIVSPMSVGGSSGSFAVEFGRAAAEAAFGALPAIASGIPQQQRSDRSSNRTRTRGGSGGAGVTVDAAINQSMEQRDTMMLDTVDGSGDDDSVQMEEDRAVSAGGGDWAVDSGHGDESESGSLSSAATAHQSDPAAPGRRRTSGEAGGQVAELDWEVNGRRQRLRRSSLTAGVPTEENQMVQDLLEAVSDAPVNHAGQWRPVRVRRGIHIWTSTVEGSPYCRIRGRMRCEATPAQLLQILIDDDRIGEYDHMFDRYELVERPNDHTSVRWTCYRAIWPTRPRDFIIRTTWEEFADGTIVIATKSVENDDFPETPTFVRGRMVMCGYVICPLGESRRRRMGSAPVVLDGVPGGAPAAGGIADGASSPGAGPMTDQSRRGRPSSEFTLYAHTDLGGNLPASVINKLCKKPAYRVLRKVQDMIATDTLVKRGEAGEGDGAVLSGGAGWPLPVVGGGATRMRRTDSEDVLGSLVAEGMPDRDDAANLEDVPEGEQEGAATGAEAEGAGQASASTPGNDTATNPATSRRDSASQLPGPTMPSPLLPGLTRDFAVSEALRIMKTVNRMASDEGLGWSQLGVSVDSGMALYKSPVVGTNKVRLGASTCVSTLPSELVGILLENAAMLGPDYIVDRQELLETFTSGVNTGGSETEAAARVDGRASQHDTAIYWFSCTHKRQRICRDFVILRCFRPLPGGGAVIAYSSVDHPGLPPCPDYVRGRLDVSGFVILPSTLDNEASSGQAPSREVEDEEEPAPLSDDEQNRRNDARRGRRRRVSGEGGANARRSSHQRRIAQSNSPDVARRRSRLSAISANPLVLSEDESESSRGLGARESRGARGRALGRTSFERRGCSAISEVTFFTHLTFSAYLPDFQEMEAVRQFVGPLHILQELKWVVERTLGSSVEDEVLVDAAARLQSGGIDVGPDWGQVTGARRRSSTDGDVVATTVAESTRRQRRLRGVRDEAASPSVSETDSTPLGDAVVSNAVLLRVPARREAMLRDMLAFASDGECMDGPQVDWRLIKHGDGTRLWRANVPGTVWCMIRTRVSVPAAPPTVLNYLLDDACIPTYDELFDKIEVVEPVDNNSVFKRTCYKPIWPTAPRDFSLLCSWGTLEEGTSYLLNRSVDHPLNPPVKGCVRGVVMLCGFLMVPRSPEAGGGCTITMIVHTDLGGNLPAGILNHLSTSSPWRLTQRLRGIFERRAAGEVTVVAPVTGAAAGNSSRSSSSTPSQAGSVVGVGDVGNYASGASTLNDDAVADPLPARA